MILGVLVGPDPAWRMRILASQAPRADAPGLVTTVASLRAVTAEATGRLRRRLHRVASHKISRVNEVSCNLFRPTHFDFKTLTDIVTVVATLF